MKTRVIGGIAVALGSVWALGGVQAIAVCWSWRSQMDPFAPWIAAFGATALGGLAIAIAGLGVVLGRPWGGRFLPHILRVAFPAMALVVGGVILTTAVAWHAPPLFPISAAVITVLSAAAAWTVGRRVALLFPRPPPSPNSARDRERTARAESLRVESEVSRVEASRAEDAARLEAAASRIEIESVDSATFRPSSSWRWIVGGTFLAAALVVGVVLARRGAERGPARPAPPDLVKTVCVRGRSSTPATEHMPGQPGDTDLEIDQYEVTVDQYRACVEAGACGAPTVPERAYYPLLCNAQKPDRGNHPMNCVSFVEAQKFCQWTGKRLPSIDEWMFVAYANDGRKYPWGFHYPDGDDYYHGLAGQDRANGGSLPVGSKPLGATYFRTFDMIGNVAEWTAGFVCLSNDCSGLQQATRGGSFVDSSEVGRVYVGSKADVNGDANVGFRCTRNIPPKPECLEPPLQMMGRKNPNFEASGKMVLVPAGDFNMGSEDEESSKPVHRVHADAFYLDLTEVSIAAFAKCAKAGSCDSHHYTEENSAVSVGVPVDEAERYCRWVGKRLPTESEWEYAAGGTDGRPFVWGKELPGKQVCWGGPGSGYVLERRTEPCRIGGHPSDKSPFGLIDMGGNKSEWTSSSFCSYAGGKCIGDRVARGGDQTETEVVNMLVTHRIRRRVDSQSGEGIRCAHTPP